MDDILAINYLRKIMDVQSNEQLIQKIQDLKDNKINDNTDQEMMEQLNIQVQELKEDFQHNLAYLKDSQLTQSCNEEIDLQLFSLKTQLKRLKQLFYYSNTFQQNKVFQFKIFIIEILQQVSAYVPEYLSVQLSDKFLNLINIQKDKDNYFSYVQNKKQL